jgi:hypothetical protein
MISEVPTVFGAIELRPVEADATPCPGTGTISVFSDDAARTLVMRNETGKSLQLSPSVATFDTQRVVFNAATPTTADTGGLGSLWICTAAGQVVVYLLTAVSEGSYTWTRLAEDVS